MEIDFARSARGHRIGRASVRWLMASAEPADGGIVNGAPALWWVGPDDRGRELEVLALTIQGDDDPEPVLLVIHVMPTHFQKEQR